MLLINFDHLCFNFLFKGPCKRGHWLVRGKQGFATCQKNPCPEIENQDALLDADIPENNYYFTLRQDNSFQCYKTGTQAFCDKGERAFFLGSESYPKCLKYEPWQCSHYSGGSSSVEYSQSVTTRQGDPRPAPGFGVPYDGI